MNSKLMGQGMLLAWAGLGVKIEKEVETQESFTMYISVPESSYNKDNNGEEMAGKHLASRVKQTLVDLGVKRLVMKYRVRQGDDWTKEKDKNAVLEMEKILYGSQY